MGQVIGIDFGTTTTEVSYIKDNAEVIKGFSNAINKALEYAKANALDGWFDRNRTGYPALAGTITVRVDDTNPAAGLTPGYELGTLVDPGGSSMQPKQMPRRLMTPTSSSQYNPNAPVTKELYEPMWWQVADGQ